MAKPLVLLASVIVFGWLSPSQACSPRGIPTPEELVASADAIYLARAMDYVVAPSKRKKGDAPKVVFQIIATLKGVPAQSIRFPAALSAHDDPNDGSVPYVFVRLGGRKGNCYAVTYRSDGQYVLFIKGGTPYWSPLAPTNEQVRGSSDPWVTWVQRAASGRATRPN